MVVDSDEVIEYLKQQRDMHIQKAKYMDRLIDVIRKGQARGLVKS